MNFQQISRLKDQMTAKESSYHREIAKATTIVDRDNWELRRQIDKISNAHMEELDSLKESYSEEMGIQQIIMLLIMNEYHYNCYLTLLELLKTKYENALVQLEKLKKKVDEFAKTSRSTDSVETEKDSGFVAGESSQSLVDHTNDVRD